MFRYCENVRRRVRSILVAILCGYLPASNAQVQVSVFSEQPVTAHPNSSLNIFSDVSQRGTLATYSSANINFYGELWHNEPSSRFPDESPSGLDGTGGIFRFSGELLTTSGQIIRNTGSLPFNGFPNVRIDNALNVTVEAGDQHINRSLDFINGSLILDGVNLNVGRNGLGNITGFSQRNFIVVGPDVNGGSLSRSFSGVSNTSIAFPIGTSLTSYTPISVIYRGIPQTLHVRVADGLYGKPNFPEYINKTWIIKRDFPDASGTMDLTLQHNAENEGLQYFRNRVDAYVTRFDASLRGLYDIPGLHATVTPGSITTRQAVFNAFMNTRLNIGAIKEIEYFSKSVIKQDIDENTPVNIPDAISPNGDGLNDTYIVVKRLITDKVRFEVYSRNQVLVYQHLDYDNSFDGTGNMGGFMGSVLPDGIYYFLISVNGAKGIPGYLIINR